MQGPAGGVSEGAGGALPPSGLEGADHVEGILVELAARAWRAAPQTHEISYDEVDGCWIVELVCRKSLWSLVGACELGDELVCLPAAQWISNVIFGFPRDVANLKKQWSSGW